MGKLHVILLASALLAGLATSAAGEDQLEDWPTGDYDSPDCEEWQSSHADKADPALKENAHTCEGEQWDGQGDFVDENCDLHKSVFPTAGADGWCVAIATSEGKVMDNETEEEFEDRWNGDFNDESNGIVDVASAGSTSDSIKIYAGLSVIMVGQTSVGVDACVLVGTTCGGKLFGDVAWYGEDETDKSPAGALCDSVLPGNPTTEGGKNNCLAYLFQSSGLVHAQIGDDPQYEDCPPGEYEDAVIDGDQSAECRRDNTSIGAGFSILP